MEHQFLKSHPNDLLQQGSILRSLDSQYFILYMNEHVSTLFMSLLNVSIYPNGKDAYEKEFNAGLDENSDCWHFANTVQ